MPAVLADNIDRLMTTELRPGSGNIPRGIIKPLYDAVRARCEDPLTLEFAARLAEVVHGGGDVLILTGAGGPPHLPLAEVDGLLGAVAMARTLHFEYDVTPHILVEERASGPLAATIRAASMNVWIAGSDPALRQEHAVVVHHSPTKRADCEQHAQELFSDLDVKAVLTIEKLGPNAKGVIHGATGLNYDEMHTKGDVYINLAAERSVLTGGIGDNGNELGFGVVRDEVKSIMPAGEECLCECGGGTACATATDVFIVAAISNWGGYAVSAMLAYLAGSTSTIMTGSELTRMLTACVDAGALDGGTARPSLSDDCVPYESHHAYVTMLRQMVEMALSNLSSPGH